MADASILAILEQAASDFNIPTSLFTAQAQQESSLNPNAYNAQSGATGLLQLEPSTAAGYGLTGSALLDPTANATVGANYLSDLFDQFGDWATALAAYDWGPGNVEKAQAAYGDDWLAYAPAETQNYVATILGNSGVTSSPSAGSPAAAPAGPVLPSPFSTIVTPTDDSGDLFDQLTLPSDGSQAPNLLLLLLIGVGVYFGATWLAEAFD